MCFYKFYYVVYFSSDFIILGNIELLKISLEDFYFSNVFHGCLIFFLRR